MITNRILSILLIKPLSLFTNNFTMTDIRYPSFLKKGEKATIVSPSGYVDVKLIDDARSVLESWGLIVEIAPHARNRDGRFSATAVQRLSDLQRAMDDPENRLVFCSRGGYGAVHLLEKLHFAAIGQNPKWLVGYSDITALHQLFLKNGIVSLHAPMARHLSEDSAGESSMYLKNILFGNFPLYRVDKHNLNREGIVKGTLFGGNLSVLCGLLGSDCMTIPPDGILFIEDIAEPAYKIDRMIWSLKLSGVLRKIKGIIVGSFTGCPEDPLMYSSIYESINNITGEYGIPLAFGFPVGHTFRNYPLLHGATVCLNVKENEVELSKI